MVANWIPFNYVYYAVVPIAAIVLIVCIKTIQALKQENK